MPPSFGLQENFSLPKNLTDTVACSAWEFTSDDKLGNTWSSEWDLVCDKEYLKNVAEMFFLAGVATGGITSGVLSDKFGRKMMLFISAVLQSIFGKNASEGLISDFVPTALA